MCVMPDEDAPTADVLEPMPAVDLTPVDDHALLPIIDLGRLDYARSLAVQRHLHAQVVTGDRPGTVLLVEHDPVVTISRRKAATQHLLASPAALKALGIDVQPTDRGGDVTYHGPGQLVVYPIIRFAPLNLNVSRYMRLLEEIIIDALVPFGIQGIRDGCATGVWVRVGAAAQAEAEADKPRPHVMIDSTGGSCPADAASAATAKIAALGVRLSRNVSLHGLALNVDPDMSHFNTIVPCGLLNRTVTSMRQVLGDATPAMAKVKQAMITSLRRHLLA